MDTKKCKTSTVGLEMLSSDSEFCRNTWEEAMLKQPKRQQQAVLKILKKFQLDTEKRIQFLTYILSSKGE